MWASSTLASREQVGHADTLEPEHLGAARSGRVACYLALDLGYSRRMGIVPFEVVRTGNPWLQIILLQLLIRSANARSLSGPHCFVATNEPTAHTCDSRFFGRN
jgi:hypothetical protein